MQIKSVLILLYLVGLNILSAQINIPMTKQSIRSEYSEYENDCLYTLDFVVDYMTKYSLKAVVDLYNEKNWVVDITCYNCFTTKQTSNVAFNCGYTCGEPEQNENPDRFLGDKLKVVSEIHLNSEATLDQYNIFLRDIRVIVQLKDSYNNPTSRLYLDHAQAGLGFSPEALKSSRTHLSQIFKIFQNQRIEKQFSLFFNTEFGRLLIGKSESFFKTSECYTFKIVEDGEFKQSWGVKLGPYFTAKGLPDISTIDSVRPDPSRTQNLYNVYFDSTSKYLEFPLSVWDRLNKFIFSFNGCNVDQSGNSICDCPSQSTTWVSIGFSLVNNPYESSLENNTSKFILNPKTYLETIKGGKSDGKCLLLIRPCDSKVSQDYSFGTSFLSEYYSIFNFEKKTIELAKSHGFVPSELHINKNYRTCFIIFSSIICVLSIYFIIHLLKGVKLNEQYDYILYKPHLQINQPQQQFQQPQQILQQPQQQYQQPQQILQQHQQQFQQPQQILSSREQDNNIMIYQIRSPVQIESNQQINNQIKSNVNLNNNINYRLINTPQRVEKTYTDVQVY